NVVAVEIPPLRERHEDVAALADYFLHAAGRRLGKSVRFAEDTVTAMSRYHWPGNVRELENLIERLAILNRDGTITVAELPKKLLESAVPAATPVHMTDAGVDLTGTLEQLEDSLIEE